MAGKRYTDKEIARIVELKDSGDTTFEAIAVRIKTEFEVDRNIKSLKVIYDRHKGGSPAAEEPVKAGCSGKKAKKVLVEEAA